MLHYQTVDAGTLELLKKLLSVDLFSGLRLAGGTSLALQMWHRKSIDLDLFGNIDVEVLEINQAIAQIGNITPGIKRIQQQFIAHGLQPPVFKNSQHGFKVVVSAKKHKEGVEADDKLSIQKKILALIKRDTLVTAKTLSTIIGISPRKIEENLRKLKQMESIKRVGTKSTRHWEIIESSLSNQQKLGGTL